MRHPVTRWIALVVGALAFPFLLAAAPPPTVVLIPSLTVVSRTAPARTWPVTIIVTSRAPVQVALDTLRPIPAPGTGASAFAPAGPAPAGWSWGVGHNGSLAAGTYHWTVHTSHLPPTATYVGVVVTDPPTGTGSVRVAQQAIAVLAVPGPAGAPAQAPQVTATAQWGHGAWQVTLAAHNPGPTSYLVNGRLDFYHGSTWVGDHAGIVWPLLLPGTTATRVVSVPGTPFAERVRVQWYWGTAPHPGSTWLTLNPAPTGAAVSGPSGAPTGALDGLGHWIGHHPNVVGAGAVTTVAGGPLGFLLWWDRRRRAAPRSFWGL